MQQNEIILPVIELILGGVTAFLAIMLWSRTRDGAWMSIVAGMIVSYAGIVYNILCSFGIITNTFRLAGVPVLQMVFVAVPFVFFIVAFILVLVKNR
jgi:hypothetical protein